MRFKEILKRWNLGEDAYEIGFFGEEPFERSLEATYKEVNAFSQDLLIGMDEVVLTVLFSDLCDVIYSDGEIGEHEKELLNILKNNWKSVLDKELDSVLKIQPGENILPQNSLVALGYLFLITMKSDGVIDKSEISKLRANLKVWNNENARLILAAINIAENAVESNDILKIFEEQSYFNDEIKNLIVRCLEYLKENEYVGVRRIMYQQLMGVILADSKIHNNERWIREKIREIWDDIEG
ncbi:hypothetical protein M900_0892 [Bacteriovorax sp. Seq25_V]|nr:hypothetical protein M900_0892 [Bacteriovorax sp. Seq25_V]